MLTSNDKTLCRLISIFATYLIYGHKEQKETLLTVSYIVHCPDNDDDLTSLNETIDLNIFVSINQM